MGNLKCAVAADDNQGIQLHLAERLDTRIGIVGIRTQRADRILKGVAAVRRPENRAAEPEDAGDVVGPNGRVREGSSRPSKLSSSPRTSMSELWAAFTTARMTALSPGASPPPVRTPIFFTDNICSALYHPSFSTLGRSLPFWWVLLVQ